MISSLYYYQKKARLRKNEYAWTRILLVMKNYLDKNMIESLMGARSI